MSEITVDNQTITEEQLRDATNAEAGWKNPDEPTETEESQVTPEPEPTPEPEKPKQKTETAPESQVIPEEILKALEETPFKDVPSVVKSYKELQARDTQLSQKVKPYESLIDLAARDPKFDEYIRLALDMYTNPAVAQRYAQPQIQKPSPLQFDLNDPNQLAQYEDALDKYFELKVDTKLSSRFAETEMQNRLEGFKNDFRRKYPAIKDDLDQLLNWAKSEGVRINPYEAAYRLRNWDNRESEITEKVRKELTKKIETASEKTPQGTPAESKNTVNQIDVGKYIAKYGLDKANKKFTPEIVNQALRDLTNET